mgnify:CR=1 FL=1
MELFWSEPSYYDTTTVDEILERNAWLEEAISLAKIRSKFEAEEGCKKLLYDLCKSHKIDVIDEYKWP